MPDKWRIGYETSNPEMRHACVARATIDGTKADGATILVETSEATTPAQARFAWQNAPSPNLVNGADLPASPFQRDNWQGGSGE
ncbi:MAG: hypothetical protein NTX50_27010 [Candidatus Sumerlaeota bacterium]|nr:hypothetical protein [Candidatus Sumerlaeota bacterium]